MTRGGSPDVLHRLERIPLRTGGVRRLEQFSAATSLIVFVGTIANLVVGAEAWAAIAVGWICLLATGLILLLLVQERRARRLISYAIALDRVHKVFQRIKEIQVLALEPKADTQVVPLLRTAMTATAEAFTVITGTMCRACIKQVSFPDAGRVGEGERASLRDFQVKTLVRDETTGTRAHDRDSVYVDQNSDFEELFVAHDGPRWFWSNDLESLNGYKNSSWQNGDAHEYVATCVWPIEYRDPAKQDSAATILGFLCVDSQNKHVFDESFDYYLGASISDGLYSALKLLRSHDHNDVHSTTRTSNPSETSEA